MIELEPTGHELEASCLKLSSSRIGTPKDNALSYFEPGSSPRTRKEVFLLTESVTFPPCASMNCFASSRLKTGRVPVITKVIPRRDWETRAVPVCSSAWGD